jgi:hypothetical protein
MFELTNGLEKLPVADSIVTDEVAQLGRRSRRRGGKKTVNCLITLTNVLNDLELNVLNIFGGSL